MDIVGFIFGGFFAGVVNTGIIASCEFDSQPSPPSITQLNTYSPSGHLIQLTTHPEWIAKIRAEVAQVAAKYAEDPTAPVHEQLLCIPLEAWETELPLMEMALKETMRLNFQTPMVRRNTTEEDIMVGDEAIPGRALVVSDLNGLNQFARFSPRLDSCIVLPQYLRSHEPGNLSRSRSLGPR